MAVDPATSMLIVIWIGLPLSILAVVLRLYSRSKVGRHLSWDDHFMIIGLALDIAATVCLTIAASYGFGHEGIPTPDLIETLMLHGIAQPLSVIGQLCARISITFLLIGLFPRHRPLKIFLVVVTILNSIFAILPVTMIFTCRPVQKQWESSLDGWCPDPQLQISFAKTKASISALTDLATALWPILIIGKLQMKLRDKIALGVIFGLAILAMISCIVEAYYLSNLGSGGTSDLPILWVWISTQCNLVIIVGCIPTLRSMLQKRFSRSRAQKSGSKASRQHAKTPYPTHDKFSNASTRIDTYGHELAGLETVSKVKHPGASTFDYSQAHHDRSASEEYILPAAGDLSFLVDSTPPDTIQVVTDVAVFRTPQPQ